MNKCSKVTSRDQTSREQLMQMNKCSKVTSRDQTSREQ